MSLWKQGGEISKSYLSRRELRQQKGVHSVSGSKAAIYTASLLHCGRHHQAPLLALYLPALCLYLTVYLCADICWICA